MTATEIKAEAKAMHKRGEYEKLCQCYEALAHKYGYKDWNTFVAVLKVWEKK